MEKLFKKIASKAKVVKKVLASKYGEGFVDTSLNILIAVVIGTLVLAGLYALFNVTVMPTVTTKVSSMFTYSH